MHRMQSASEWRGLIGSHLATIRIFIRQRRSWTSVRPASTARRTGKSMTLLLVVVALSEHNSALGCAFGPRSQYSQFQFRRSGSVEIAPGLHGLAGSFRA